MGKGPSNVVICGLTAAGKTTHAKILASHLGYRYVSGTATLARLCGVCITGDPPEWTDIADAVARRRHDGIDVQLEDELLRLSREESGQVFDVWALPWTNNAPELVRIWIESSPASRTAKCFVSRGDDRRLSLRECGPFIHAKDDDNRQLFRRMLGFDLFRDHDVFQVILDNTAFITKPTREAADRGIEEFAPFLLSAVDFVEGKQDSRELFDLERRCTFGTPIVLKAERRQLL